MSSRLGAGIRIPRQRDRSGSMIFEAELQSNIMRHWEEYLRENSLKTISYQIDQRRILKNKCLLFHGAT